MGKWYFNVLFALDELPNFMTTEGFSYWNRPTVNFRLRDYRILRDGFLTVTSRANTVLLYINFVTVKPFELVRKDFKEHQCYYFNLIIDGHTYKVCGRVMDFFCLEGFDPRSSYTFLTSKNNRLQRD